MQTSTRTFIDCREFPSERNCSLKISGTPGEVLAVATAHAVADHGHTDTPELRAQLQSALREER